MFSSVPRHTLPYRTQSCTIQRHTIKTLNGFFSDGEFSCDQWQKVEARGKEVYLDDVLRCDGHKPQ